MKNYIFLNTTIANIGGAEVYISKKCEHLTNLGYNVIVVSFESGKILIDNLRPFEKYIIPNLKVPFRRSNKRIRKKILEIFKNMNLTGTIILESNTYDLNSWGEYIAKEINAYHICYLLPEINRLYKDDYGFYIFKYRHNCLFGITAHSISDLMADGKDYPNTELRAVGQMVGAVAEKVLDNLHLKKADYTILSLGRLNKPYIPHMLDNIYYFSQEHKNKSINLLLVGGYSTKIIDEKILEIQSNSDNINIYRLGEFRPIPSQIFQISDVSIAVAGCANICHSQGLPNIVIDARDYKGIGIYKHSTDNTTYRTSEAPIKVSSLLEDVLEKKIYTKSQPMNLTNSSTDYSKHDALLRIPNKIEYYNLSTTPDSFLALLVKLLIYVIGSNKYYKILSIVRKYKN